MKTPKTLTIEGSAVHDIATFYDEINRVFMLKEDWKLGQSLDALDDLLYGGFGAIEGQEAITLVWRDIERSKAALGHDATLDFYLAKLAHPEMFDRAWTEKKIADLESGNGATYFEIILDIISGHRNIELRPE